MIETKILIASDSYYDRSTEQKKQDQIGLIIFGAEVSYRKKYICIIGK